MTTHNAETVTRQNRAKGCRSQADRLRREAMRLREQADYKDREATRWEAEADETERGK